MTQSIRLRLNHGIFTEAEVAGSWAASNIPPDFTARALVQPPTSPSFHGRYRIREEIEFGRFH
jgi:hypothetical protein